MIKMRMKSKISKKKRMKISKENKINKMMI